MPTFHAPRNPNFNLSSHRLRKPIRFTDGYYTTEDPEEVRALRRSPSVEEVEERKPTREKLERATSSKPHAKREPKEGKEVAASSISQQIAEMPVGRTFSIENPNDGS